MQYILIFILSVLFVVHSHETQASETELVINSCEQLSSVGRMIERLKNDGMTYPEYTALMFSAGLSTRDTNLFSAVGNLIYNGGFSSKDLYMMCVSHVKNRGM